VLPRITKRDTLADQIAENIRMAVLYGRLDPTEPLTEASIAAQLGVSRAPVREALITLSTEGLVEKIPNRGTYRILALTHRGVDEIFELRTALEVLAFKKAATNIGPEEASRLEELSSQMAAAAERGDGAEFAHLDMLFHSYIYELSSNHRLLLAWENLKRSVTIIVTFNNLHDRNLAEAARSHGALTAELLAGAVPDPPLSLVAHLENSCRLAHEFLGVRDVHAQEVASEKVQ
jgi:DNA-binding GntR family transcriptional regulator